MVQPRAPVADKTKKTVLLTNTGYCRLPPVIGLTASTIIGKQLHKPYERVQEIVLERNGEGL